MACDDGALWLPLPPWLRVFDRHGAIFANEPPVGEGLQILAEGRAEPQPSSGEFGRWLTADNGGCSEVQATERLKGLLESMPNT